MTTRTLHYQGTPVPTVSAAQMAWVDERMMHAYHVQLLQMMENAGAALAALSAALMHSRRRPSVAVLAGAGGNGGGGMAAARRLAAWGWSVQVLLTHSKLRDAAKTQREILDAMAVSVHPADPRGMSATLARADLIIDAVLGYSIVGAPRGLARAVIQAANASGAPILALDIPSGLHPDSGVPFEPTIDATATLTLALPKAGLAAATAEHVVGTVYLADIGVPSCLYTELGLFVPPLFPGNPYIQLDNSK